MLLEQNNSCLLLIDIQEKLTPLVHQPAALIARCQWLLRLAQELRVPHLLSEQYPRGLGHTVDGLLSLTHEEAIPKVHFSCWREPRFKVSLQALKKSQTILIGIESHVCVLQTAMDLRAAGYDVFVVVDAVSSRYEIDYKYALKRMKQSGIQLITAEMVLFEWVEQAGTEAFKGLSKRFLQ